MCTHINTGAKDMGAKKRVSAISQNWSYTLVSQPALTAAQRTFIVYSAAKFHQFSCTRSVVNLSNNLAQIFFYNYLDMFEYIF